MSYLSAGMMILLCVVFGVMAVALGLLFSLARRAPEGYEDRDGFHRGRPVK